MPPQNACQEFVNFFLQENDIEKALDAVELSFRFIDGPAREWQYANPHDVSKIADDAIEELNSGSGNMALAINSQTEELFARIPS